MSAQAHLTTLVEDFLSNLVFEKFEKEEISDNTEELAIQNIEEGMEEGTVTHKVRELSFSDGVRIRRKIDKVLDRIHTYIGHSTALFYTSKRQSLKDSEKLEITHINALLIGLSLILKYLDKHFTQASCEITIGYSCLKKLEKIEKEYSLERLKNQIGNPDGVVSYDVDLELVDAINERLKQEEKLYLVSLDKQFIKEKKHYFFEPVFGKDLATEFFVINLGSFLHALNNQWISFQIESQNLFKVQVEKIKSYSILLILRYYWPRRDRKLRDLLLLNIFNSFKVTMSFKEMKLYLEDLLQQHSSLDEASYENMDEVLKLYKRYNSFKSNIKSNGFSEPLSPLLEKQIVFSTKYGFCIIDKVKSNDTLNLNTPLGTDNSKTNLYGFTEVYISQKVKIFRNKKLVQ